MKIIIDECVPSIVKRGLPNRDITTVQEMGWAGVKNGKLLKLVAAEFDVSVTSDKNLLRQQNLASLELSVILLPSNQVPAVDAILGQLDSTLESIGPNEFIMIKLAVSGIVVHFSTYTSVNIKLRGDHSNHGDGFAVFLGG